MKINKPQMVAMLRAVGLAEDHQFKKRAYYKSAKTLEDYDGEINHTVVLIMEGIPGNGIGNGIADKVRDMLDTGTFPRYEQYKKEGKIDMPTVLRTTGKKIKPKKSGDIKKMPLGTAEHYANEVVRIIKPMCSKIEIVGSIRRNKYWIADADILVMATWDLEGFKEHFINAGYKIKSCGSTKLTIEGKTGFQSDITKCNSSWGSHLLHFTGSKDHNIKLRKIAKTKGGSLSQNGIQFGDCLMEFNTERQVFKQLGVPYVEPEKR